MDEIPGGEIFYGTLSGEEGLFKLIDKDGKAMNVRVMTTGLYDTLTARNAVLEAEHEAVGKHLKQGFKYSDCGCQKCGHKDCIDAWGKLDQAHQKGE